MKTRTAEELSGMTVNERLFATDQFDEFDAAVASLDETKLRQVLGRLHLGEANVDAITKGEMSRSRWKKRLALFAVWVMSFSTIALLFTAASEGGWWIAGAIAWLPCYYTLCAYLGHPESNYRGSDDGPPPFGID